MNLPGALPRATGRRFFPRRRVKPRNSWPPDATKAKSEGKAEGRGRPVGPPRSSASPFPKGLPLPGGRRRALRPHRLHLRHRTGAVSRRPGPAPPLTRAGPFPPGTCACSSRLRRCTRCSGPRARRPDMVARQRGEGWGWAAALRDAVTSGPRGTPGVVGAAGRPPEGQAGDWAGPGRAGGLPPPSGTPAGPRFGRRDGARRASPNPGPPGRDSLPARPAATRQAGKSCACPPQGNPKGRGTSASSLCWKTCTSAGFALSGNRYPPHPPASTKWHSWHWELYGSPHF